MLNLNYFSTLWSIKFPVLIRKILWTILKIQTYSQIHHFLQTLFKAIFKNALIYFWFSCTTWNFSPISSRYDQSESITQRWRYSDLYPERLWEPIFRTKQNWFVKVRLTESCQMLTYWNSDLSKPVFWLQIKGDLKTRIVEWKIRNFYRSCTQKKKEIKKVRKFNLRESQSLALSIMS